MVFKLLDAIIPPIDARIPVENGRLIMFDPKPLTRSGLEPYMPDRSTGHPYVCVLLLTRYGDLFIGKCHFMVGQTSRFDHPEKSEKLPEHLRPITDIYMSCEWLALSRGKFDFYQNYTAIYHGKRSKPAVMFYSVKNWKMNGRELIVHTGDGERLSLLPRSELMSKELKRIEKESP